MAWLEKLTCSVSLLVTVMFSSLCANAQDNPQWPSITVRLYNDVHAPKPVLIQAMKIAQDVLRGAEVQVTWQDCTGSVEGSDSVLPCDSRMHHTDIALHLIAQLERIAPWIKESALGCSIIPDQHRLATAAYIDYFRVRDLSASVSFSLGQLLGFAAAHEIGHILLGSNSHSMSGIMRASWRSRDLVGRYREEFAFTGEQAQKLRAAAWQRTEYEARLDDATHTAQ